MATLTELAQGRNATLSDRGGDEARTRERAFKIALASVNEPVDYVALSGVFVGQIHPTDDRLICSNMSVRYEGDSRLVQVLTCSYSAFTPEGDDKEQPPDVRPARWTTSAAMSEIPVRSWYKRTGQFAWADRSLAINPVNDAYDGVVAPQPVVRISITQFESVDPTRHLGWVGCVNSETITLGSLTIRPHQLIFSSLNQSPAVENWGAATYTGWNAEYEFLFKRNPSRIRYGGAWNNVDIGWDIAVPQSGWSVFAFDPAAPGADDDEYGQPLRHGDQKDKPDEYGMILSPLQLPENVAAGSKQRAMVGLPSYTNKGRSQSPSGSPVALNDNGRPRKWTSEPLVYAYQPGEAINITQDLGLRIQ